MDAREKLKMRHTVTVGMSWFRNQQTKGISKFRREMKVIGLTVKIKLVRNQKIKGTKSTKWK